MCSVNMVQITRHQIENTRTQPYIKTILKQYIKTQITRIFILTVTSMVSEINDGVERSSLPNFLFS